MKAEDKKKMDDALQAQTKAGEIFFNLPVSAEITGRHEIIEKTELEDIPIDPEVKPNGGLYGMIKRSLKRALRKNSD